MKNNDGYYKKEKDTAASKEPGEEKQVPAPEEEVEDISGRTAELPDNLITDLDAEAEERRQAEADQKKQEEEKKKFHFRDLLYNNRFLMFLSVFLAIVVWVIVTLTSSSPRELTFVVPVSVELPANATDDMNLKVVSQSQDTVNVTVKGSQFDLAGVKAEQFKAVAQVASVTGPGTYQVEIKVPLPDNANYTIEKVSPTTTEVVLDRTARQDFSIVPTLTKYAPADGYELKQPVLADPIVTVTGPESQVAKINSVAVNITVDSVISETKTYEAKVVLYDEAGNEIPYKDADHPEAALSLSFEKTQLTIVALAVRTIPITVDYTNKPDVFSQIKITTTPSKLDISGPIDVFDSLKELKVGTIDFSKVDTSHTKFEFPIDVPSGCANRGDTDTVTVELNLSGMRSRDFTITNFQVKNEQPNTKVTLLTRSMVVRITGLAAEIEPLDDADIVAIVDGSTLTDATNGHEVPVSISIANATGSWVYGSPTVFVRVEKK